MPKKTPVKTDTKGKQKKAGRMIYKTEKQESNIYKNWGEKLIQLGLSSCDATIFPGNAPPQAERIIKGQNKVRKFTLFSAKDFANVVDSGFLMIGTGAFIVHSFQVTRCQNRNRRKLYDKYPKRTQKMCNFSY